MLCPRCRNRVNNTDIFCNVCGLALQNVDIRGKGGLRTIHIVLIILSVITLFSTLVLFIFNMNNDEESPPNIIEKTIIKEPYTINNSNQNNEQENTVSNINQNINNNIEIKDIDNILNNNTQENNSINAVEKVPVIEGKPKIKEKFNNIKASSVLPNEYGYTYYPENLLDGDSTTAWVENAEGDGIGEWIELSSTDLETVNGIRIVNGYCKSEDLYNKNNRVKDITIHINDKIYNYKLADEYRKVQDIKLSTIEETDKINIRIDSVYNGNKYQDTCLSQIEIY